MLSVIILDNGEPRVVKFTYENLYRELKDIEGAQLVVAEDWFKALKGVKNQYVCLVESDCLVSSGYFASQMGLIKKNSYLRKLGIFSSATGANSFGNRFYGYELSEKWSEPTDLESGTVVQTKNRSVEPVRQKKSTAPYPIQIAYIPGSILRMSTLAPLLEKIKISKNYKENLVDMSAQLSLDFWQRGARIHINPNTTYVTTEGYVNDLGEVASPDKELTDMFHKESI